MMWYLYIRFTTVHLFFKSFRLPCQSQGPLHPWAAPPLPSKATHVYSRVRPCTQPCGAKSIMQCSGVSVCLRAWRLCALPTLPRLSRRSKRRDDTAQQQQQQQQQLTTKNLHIFPLIFHLAFSLRSLSGREPRHSLATSPSPPPSRVPFFPSSFLRLTPAHSKRGLQRSQCRVPATHLTHFHGPRARVRLRVGRVDGGFDVRA